MSCLKGINLGGWLVAERWMTPDLFEGVQNDGEISLVRELGKDEAARRLDAHRGSFITKKDFMWIRQHGFDVIRLPVGYWLFEETPDFIDGEEYLKKAFQWADEYGLKVILDFHGLQGSQNGLDHSGRVGPVHMYWPWNKRKALQTLEYMCQTYGNEPALIGLEVINEPSDSWFLWRLMRYYDKAFTIAEQYLPRDCRIIVSDAFKPRTMAKRLLRKSYAHRIVLDIHLYQAHYLDNDPHATPLTLNQHIDVVENEWSSLLEELSSNFEILVGEWSGALPSAAYKSIEGGELVGVGTYIHAQQKLYQQRAWAECYWTYKAPGLGIWDYHTLDNK
ncbi:MAG: cellulase family glycosylhydrolase [Candidatus Saccharimonadales bacterium]